MPARVGTAKSGVPMKMTRSIDASCCPAAFGATTMRRAPRDPPPRVMAKPCSSWTGRGARTPRTEPPRLGRLLGQLLELAHDHVALEPRQEIDDQPAVEVI